MDRKSVSIKRRFLIYIFNTQNKWEPHIPKCGSIAKVVKPWMLNQICKPKCQHSDGIKS